MRDLIDLAVGMPNVALDDVKHGKDTPLPKNIGAFPLGGTFALMAKGRYHGGQIAYNFF